MRTPGRSSFFPIALVVAVAVVAAYKFGAHRGESHARKDAEVSVFSGQITSLNADGVSGCVQPAVAAERVELVCGPLWFSRADLRRVGARVQVYSVRARTADNEDVSGYLLTPQ